MPTDEITVITEPAEVVAELDAAWRESPPRKYNGTVCTPLLGSESDQGTVGENPYWDIVRRLPLDPSCRTGGPTEVEGFPRFGDSYAVGRRQLTKSYAWAIPTPGDIAWIVETLDGRDVVEVGAGTGYWAWQLGQSGVDVAAYDAKPFENHWCGGAKYHSVRKGGPEMAAEFPRRALMLCWPPYDDPMAEDALSCYKGDLLIYVGESDGGCTAGDGFFRLLERDWTHIGDSPAHVTFSGIHCYVEAYARKGGGL